MFYIAFLHPFVLSRIVGLGLRKIFSVSLRSEAGISDFIDS